MRELNNYSIKFLVLLLLIASVTVAQSTPSKLIWTASSTLEDGSEMSDLGGYKIYCGPTAHNLLHIKDVGNTLEYLLKDLNSECRYFAVTAYRQNGLESEKTSVCSTLRPAPSSGCSIR